MRGSPKKRIDWDAVEIQYRLGQKTTRNLATEFGCAHSSIVRRAQKFNWVQDKSEEVKERTKAALLTHQAEGRNTPTKEDIEIAVRANIQVVEKHRKLVKRTMDLAERLLETVEKEKTVDPNKHGRMFQMVSQGLAKVVPLERQAYNLNDTRDTGNPLLELLDNIAKRAIPLVKDE